MADSFSRIYIQVTFAVKWRERLIAPEWENELYKYITGIVQGKEQLLIAIGGMPDHIHIFIGMKPTCCLADLVREIKKSSNQFINDSGFVKGRFAWQQGYGAFSCSRWDAEKIENYVLRQKEHHKYKSFKEEYIHLLEQNEVLSDTKNLFEFEE